MLSITVPLAEAGLQYCLLIPPPIRNSNPPRCKPVENQALGHPRAAQKQAHSSSTCPLLQSFEPQLLQDVIPVHLPVQLVLAGAQLLTPAHLKPPWSLQPCPWLLGEQERSSKE